MFPKPHTGIYDFKFYLNVFDWFLISYSEYFFISLFEYEKKTVKKVKRVLLISRVKAKVRKKKSILIQTNA